MHHNIDGIADVNKNGLNFAHVYVYIITPFILGLVPISFIEVAGSVLTCCRSIQTRYDGTDGMNETEEFDLVQVADVV